MAYSRDHISGAPADSSAGLFERIILAIKEEQELRQSRKILYFFLIILGVSFGALPFSVRFFISEWSHSGILYFLYVAAENSVLFLSLWQDFLLSIIESLPMMATVLFSLNLMLLLFTVRLFLYKKSQLFTLFYQRSWKNHPSQ